VLKAAGLTRSCMRLVLAPLLETACRQVTVAQNTVCENAGLVQTDCVGLSCKFDAQLHAAGAGAVLRDSLQTRQCTDKQQWHRRQCETRRLCSRGCVGLSCKFDAQLHAAGAGAVFGDSLHTGNSGKEATADNKRNKATEAQRYQRLALKAAVAPEQLRIKSYRCRSMGPTAFDNMCAAH
jgi:hypothetical protein